MHSLPRLLLLISLPLYVIDQITKWYVVLNLERGVAHPVIDGYFNIMRVHNQGVAFGAGNGSTWAPFVFLAILPIAIVGIVIMWRKNFFEGNLGRISAPLLISGIAGNMTDRLFQGFWLPQHAEEPFFTRLFHGYVVDFLDVTIPVINYRWPTFNVADSCIVVAAVCLLISGFFPEDKKTPAANA